MSTPLADSLPQADEEAALFMTGATLFQQRVERRPDTPALLDVEDRSGFGLSPGAPLTYGEAGKRVEALAACLAGQGLEPGDVIGVQMPNVAETVLLLLAAWRCGLTVASFPYLWRELELAEASAMVQPSALIGGGIAFGSNVSGRLCEIAATNFSVRLVAGFGLELADGVLDLDAAMRADAETDPPRPATGSHAPALITFTARPRHALLPLPFRSEELLAQGALTVLSLGIDAGDRLLSPFPLSGLAGLSLGLMPWLIAGGALILHQPFEWDGYARQVMESRATVTALPASLVNSLLAEPSIRSGASHLRRLGRVTFDAAPARCENAKPPPTLQLFDARVLGDLACVLSHAATDGEEVSLPQGRLAAARDDAVFLETAPGRRTDTDAAELLLAGSAVPKADGGALAPDARGFVGTGLCCLPVDGAKPRLRLVPSPEWIRHGAFAISPSDLDSLYAGFPAAADAACVALPDRLTGSRLVAAMVPRRGQSVTLAGLEIYLGKRQVAPYKYPEAVLTVPAIPRRANGCVARNELMAQVSRQLAERDRRPG